jgi:alkylation response protein AidB-like acyl-CoA dehydrogenase
MRSEFLTEADLGPMLETVQRFAGRALANATARPEVPLPHAVARDLLDQLGHMGVLNAAAEPAGGLWDDPQDPLQRVFAVETLRCLAAYAPGFAYQVHVQGLAHGLNRQYRREAGDGVVCLDGRVGIGRQALVQALAGQVLASEQAAQLADCWAPPVAGAPRMLHALPDWQAVWMPLWQPDLGFQWLRFERAAVDVQLHANGHGLDGLSTHTLGLRSAPDWDAAVDAAASRRSTIELMALHGLGLLAMATGAAQGAVAMATDYSRVRKQGGQVIADHVAVGQLLANGSNAVWLAQGCLQQLCRREPDLPLLVDVWRARVQLHPLLCMAASHAMQVLGGMGYMRDNGVERLLRDCNQLRLLAGSPAELTLCCAQWERGQ